jgi:hypothetical protein
MSYSFDDGQLWIGLLGGYRESRGTARQLIINAHDFRVARKLDIPRGAPVAKRTSARPSLATVPW